MNDKPLIRCQQDDGDGFVCIDSIGLEGIYCSRELGECSAQLVEEENTNEQT